MGAESSSSIGACILVCTGAATATGAATGTGAGALTGTGAGAGAAARTGTGAGACTGTCLTATGACLTGAATGTLVEATTPSAAVSILTVSNKLISRLAMSFTDCNRPAPKGPPPLCFTSNCNDFAISSNSSILSSLPVSTGFAATAAGAGTGLAAAGGGTALTTAAGGGTALATGAGGGTALGAGGGGAWRGGRGLSGTAEAAGATFCTTGGGGGVATFATGVAAATGADLAGAGTEARRAAYLACVCCCMTCGFICIRDLPASTWSIRSTSGEGSVDARGPGIRLLAATAAAL